MASGKVIDISQAYQSRKFASAGIRDLFESCPLGIVEINSESEIVYANEAALHISGLEKGSYAGIFIRDLLPDKAAAKIFETQFAKRMNGASQEYDIEMLHRNGTRVPVRVVGIPLKDINHNAVGAVGIFRSLRLERASAALDARVKESTTAQEIFRAIADEVSKLEPYDLCTAWVYSENLTQARDLFTYDRQGIVRWPKRWYSVLPQRVSWIREHTEPGVNEDFIAMRQEYVIAMKDRSPEGLMENLHSAYRVPVIRKGRVIGSISFFREAKNGFDRQADENIKALPLEKAFLVAWAFLENEELRFTDELMKQIAEHEGIDLFDDQIAELIVQRLSEHYGWDAVAIFRVNSERQCFELEAQAGHADVLVAHLFTQPFGSGVIWSCYQTGKAICTPDWQKDPLYAPVFIAAFKGTVSEMCVPIRIDGEIVAILNVEDSRENAISEVEKESVGELLDRVSQLIEAQRTANIATVAFEWTPSVVFIVGEDGRISRANRSASQILGYTTQQLKGKRLSEVLKPEPSVTPMLEVDTPARDDLHLIHKNGTSYRAMVASTRLDGGIGAILSAKDITGQQRILELDYLDQMFYDIAAQTRMPLTLATAWLQRLQKRFQAGQTDPPEPDAVIDGLNKTLKQLRKAEITYDRLSLYNKEFAGGVPRNPVAISMNQLLADVKAEFPEADASRLAIYNSLAQDSYIVADIYQISFVVLATVSYALRFMPESRHVNINLTRRVRRRREWASLTIWAIAPSQDKKMRRETDRIVEEAKTEIALGTQIIKTFTEQNGGLYHGPKKLEGKIKFSFQFPIAV